MSREGIRKLLGGYATGTLTAEERQALFEAALDDQELFDELAREQPLRDLLCDPAARAQLLAALGDAPAPWHRRLGRWMWANAVGLAGVACFLALGGYVAHMAKFAPERVVWVAMEPTKVEVNGSARPSRVFDLKQARKVAPPFPVTLPPPPVIALRPPAAPLVPFAFVTPAQPAATARAPVLAAGGSNLMALEAANPGARPAAAARGGSGGGIGGSLAFPRAAPAKLDPLVAALIQRVRSGAEPGAEESRFVSEGEAYVRLTLASAPADAAEQLKNAGLAITSQEGSEVDGHIGVTKLEAMSQLPFIAWIAPR